MHSLFVRIFVLFWVAMALIVGGSIAVTFTVAAREYEPPRAAAPSGGRRNSSVRRPRARAASRRSQMALGQRASFADRDLYIVGPDGRDILGRRLSDSATRRLDYFNRELRRAGWPPIAAIFARSAPHRRSSAADGSTYTVLLAPRRPSIFGALSLPGISLMILCIALVVSAFASWWLARHLSAPIRRIQEGARALASENLDARAARACASARDSRIARTKSRCWRGTSTPWPTSCAPIAPR